MMRASFSVLAIGGLCALASAVGCSEAQDDATELDARANEAAVSAAASSMRFGVAPQWYQNYAPPTDGPANVDVVAVGDWLIENGFNDNHQRKVEQIRGKGKTPYFFGYIATALTKKGLGSGRDCDGDTSAPLCQQGADYIRGHIDSEIVPAYRAAASRIGQAVSGGEALIHIEPDWYQFSEKAQRNPFSREESNGNMNKILGAIREGCGSCKVVIDFSPWFSPDRTAWARSAGDFYAGWDRGVVKYVGLTGKPFPFTEGKIDNFTYSQITSELGLPLVIVDAYTFGGGPIDIDSTWLSADNVAKAVNMGVGIVILSQQGNVSGFDSFIAQVRGGGAPTEPPKPPEPPTQPPTEPPTPNEPGAASGDVRVSGGNVEAKLSQSSSWQGGYCADVNLTNRDGGSVTWTARIAKRGTVYNNWSSSFKEEGSDWVFTGADYNRTLSPGQSAGFGFCVTTD